MAIKLKVGTKAGIKLSVKSKTKTTSGVEAATKLVAEMHLYRNKMAALKAKVSKLQEPMNELIAKFIGLVEEDIADTDTVSVTDGVKTIKVSAKRKSTVLHDDIEGLVAALEEKQEGLSMELASFPLGELKRYMSDDELEPYVDNLLGNRSLKY